MADMNHLQKLLVHSGQLEIQLVVVVAAAAAAPSHRSEDGIPLAILPAQSPR